MRSVGKADVEFIKIETDAITSVGLRSVRTKNRRKNSTNTPFSPMNENEKDNGVWITALALGYWAAGFCSY